MLIWYWFVCSVFPFCQKDKALIILSLSKKPEVCYIKNYKAFVFMNSVIGGEKSA